MQLYEIGKLLGTGSSGEVFLCRHRKEQKYYAMKKIKMLEVQPRQKENIQNQLKLLQKLRHPNIVSFKDSFNDRDGSLCIVMLYCEMGDMHTKIKQTKEKGKNFTQAQILDWLTQTALAIHYLHSQMILHRDLKSQNIFLKQLKRDEKKEDRREDKKDERVRLGDFGISKVLDNTSDMSQTFFRGTPYYIAPEIFKYTPASYKSDIWSLGIILYQMCNLRFPFEAQHYNALALKILSKSYPSITPTYSKQLRDLITQCLNKKPQDRPTIVDILSKPFIFSRVEKYMNNMFSRSNNEFEMEDIYLDTLKQQAKSLKVSFQLEELGLKKYPSSKDLDQRLSKNLLTNRNDEEDSQLGKEHYEKRRSIFDRNSHSMDKNMKRSEESASESSKVLKLAYLGDQKQAFVDHKKTIMMEKQDHKLGMEPTKKFDQYNNRKFRIHEQYSMEDEGYQMDEGLIEQEIIPEDSDQDLQQLTTTNMEDQQEEVPEKYNKAYYKILDQIRVLKHVCQNAIKGKYIRAYNAVLNGCNRQSMLEILGPSLIGYWHLIDQIAFNQSLLKTIPKQ